MCVGPETLSVYPFAVSVIFHLSREYDDVLENSLLNASEMDRSLPTEKYSAA